MRIAILAAGSRGDYQPVLAVAHALKAAGHEVGITATSDYAPWVRAEGFHAEEIRINLMELYRSEQVSGRMPVSTAGQINMLQQYTAMLATEVTRTLVDLWPRYDGVVSTALSMAWASFMGAHDPRPQALMLFVPALPSIWGDSSMFSIRSGPSLHNLAAGVRGLGPGVRVSTPLIRTMRQQGLGEVDRWRALRHMMTSPAFVAHSPQVITARRVSGRQIRCTGYPFHDSPEGTTLTPQIESFIDAGPPPVYAGFGSQSLGATRAALQHTVDGALAAGHRVMAMRGTGLEEDRYDDRVLFFDGAPHDVLFPRMAAIAHHGGAGTTGEALRAGRPQVVVPFTMDQPFFGRRVHEIGVGAHPVRVPDASKELLAAAFRQVADPDTAARAAQVGAVVRREDGVTGALRAIEAALGGR